MTTQMIEPRMELEQNLHMYRQMAKIRAFEEQVNELYKSAKMPGLAHPYGETIAGEILARPRALGVHAETVDGQDVQAVNATMRRLVERARRGEGPAFLECKTYRYYGHHVGDVNREYRTRDEEKEWMSQHDPLATLAGRLSGQGLADQGVFDRIQTDVKAEVDNGVQYALAAPYPDANQVGEDVYA